MRQGTQWDLREFRIINLAFVFCPRMKLTSRDVQSRLQITMKSYIVWKSTILNSPSFCFFVLSLFLYLCRPIPSFLHHDSPIFTVFAKTYFLDPRPYTEPFFLFPKAQIVMFSTAFSHASRVASRLLPQHYTRVRLLAVFLSGNS